MSNGSGQSKSPYIIICSKRIQVLNSPSHKDRIQVASDGAAQLTSYYGKHVDADLSARISHLQHEMMDNFNTWNQTEADQAVEHMFELLDRLEDKMA